MKRQLLTLLFICTAVALKAQTKNAVEKDTTIYQSVDSKPHFATDSSAYSKFLCKQIRYPAKSQENGVQGKVILGFVVEKDGSLSNIKIIKSVAEDIDAESIRVLTLSPKWIPGMKNGKPVRTQWSAPMSYTLAND